MYINKKLKLFLCNPNQLYNSNNCKMNVTVRPNNPKPKHIWLEKEDRLCVYLYLRGYSFRDAHRLLPDIPISSIYLKFKNCLSLDKGKDKCSLSHCSKQHIRIFDEERKEIF